MCQLTPVHKLKFWSLLGLWMHVHRSFPTVFPGDLEWGVPQEVPIRHPLSSNFVRQCPSSDWLLWLRPLNMKVFNSLSPVDLGWQQQQSYFHHWSNSVCPTCFKLGPSRVGIRPGATVSLYLPDGEQLCSWLSKALPNKIRSYKWTFIYFVSSINF